MNRIFLCIVNMSLTASIIGAVVAVLRVLLKKRLPRWVFYLAWAVVLVRLLMPISIASPLSAFNAIPAAQTARISNEQAPERHLPPGNTILFVEDTDAAIQFPTLQKAPAGTAGENTGAPAVRRAPVPVLTIFSTIWTCGVVLLLLYSFACYAYTLCRLRAAQPVELEDSLVNGIFEAAGVSRRRVKICDGAFFDSPVVCGLIRPRLILSALVGRQELPHVMAHELTHIRRGDNIWKAAATLALYLHWFNPLLWWFYHLYVTDMEASCDEAVVRRTQTDRRAYAGSLLQMAVKSRSAFAGGFLAFGECALKERVKSIMNVKKTTALLSIICIAVVSGLSIVFLTNPQQAEGAFSPAGAVSISQPQQMLSGTASADGLDGLASQKDNASSAVSSESIPAVTQPPSSTVSEGLAAASSVPMAPEEKQTQPDVKQAENIKDAKTPSGQADGAAEPSAEESGAAESGAAESGAAALIPVREGNPPALKVQPEQIAFANLIDRENHTYYALGREEQAELLTRLNSIGAREGLQVTPARRGVILMQISLNDGSRYEYWLYSNVLMVGDTEIADERDIGPLMDLVMDYLSAAYKNKGMGAEWLGFMNPYRISGMTLAYDPPTKTDPMAPQPDDTVRQDFSASASAVQRDAILDVAAQLKALRVGVKSPVERYGDPSIPDSGRLLHTIRLDFENGMERFDIYLFSDRSVHVQARSFEYFTAYTADNSIFALVEQLDAYLENGVSAS